MRQAFARPDRRLLLWSGGVGLLLYLIFQLLPEISDVIRDPESYRHIAEAEAEAAAVRFAEAHFGGTYEPEGTVHQIRERLYGYLSREKLIKDYDDRFGPQYPVEYWQVELKGDDGSSLFVRVHMRTGDIVGWNEVSDGGRGMEFGAASLAARAFAIERGYAESDLRLRGLPEDGGIVFDVADHEIGEARLALHIRVAQADDGAIRVVSFTPEFELPEAHIRYVDRQDRIALILTYAGAFGISFVLFVIAIVYAVLLRRRTSFRRGLLLSGIYLAFYIVQDISMFDGIRASIGEVENAGLATVFMTVFQILFTIGIALSVWFAFVAGDGLWRSMGANKWRRRGEPGFGDDVWQGMKIGYGAAFALLGLQALIFLVMRLGFGIWSSADVTQSLLNFRWVWAFPLLAWCAAISEEAMYRLFGVGLFRRWFRNTAAAAVIPTVVWALGHVAYPIYPWSTRLIELTIIGLLFCWLFVRYGFAAALFTHAVFDLVLMATSLMLLGGAGNILLGIFYIVHPVGVAWLIRWWDRRRPPKPRLVPAFAPAGAGTPGFAAPGGETAGGSAAGIEAADGESADRTAADDATAGGSAAGGDAAGGASAGSSEAGGADATSPAPMAPAAPMDGASASGGSKDGGDSPGDAGSADR
ncbi:MAG: hypothetical protein A9Z00_07765 [Thermobacillus sp. ZCTH02-B1]|uniref:CPBP family intramembrane glutamic endopeptidase n=1 Tax=Thermobacillus sp. ZCTH02-B1 TaxID=1858795 RepID=UPI000B55489D|nr:type II CAAX endopeptidase family protein [Thermobacillus sp. ZCTH02-B1]OUM96211.1 MAG: hypothetical protein A9Z00_07765 [Thermobacillus sp. ZCTH02-B1]